LALAAVATLVVARRGPPPFATLTSRPITADPGSERDPDISPDGRAVAYAWVSPGLERPDEGIERRNCTAQAAAR
jgi:hypothetical protein